MLFMLLWMGFIEVDSFNDAEGPRALAHMVFTLNSTTLNFKTFV